MSFKFNPLTGKFDIVETDHTKLSNIGTNTHAQIDTALGTTIPATYLKKDGTTALTADWDAGSYEIRAQTLESDVATGTAPLTIASTTVNTNLNADLLDGLHDTGYTKTTAGQTINVATAAELTAALAGLAAAPSLLGDVTILCAAGTYANSFTIPTLIYNGNRFILEGSRTQILSTTASGNKVLPNFTTGARGYIPCNSVAGVTEGMFILCNGVNAVVTGVTGNNIEFVTRYITCTTGQTVLIYRNDTILTNSSGFTVSMAVSSNCFFKNLDIKTTATGIRCGCFITQGFNYYELKNIGFYSEGASAQCFSSTTSSIGVIQEVYINGNTSTNIIVVMNNSLLLDTGVDLISGSLYVKKSGTNTMIYTAYQGIFALASGGVFLDGVSDTGFGISSVYTSGGRMKFGIIKDCGTGWTAATYSWGNQGGAGNFIFLSCVTDKNPAAAADPAYIN